MIRRARSGRDVRDVVAGGTSATSSRPAGSRTVGKDKLFERFTFNDLRGPTTNPDQTAIDPAFGVRYVDHQRNGW